MGEGWGTWTLKRLFTLEVWAHATNTDSKVQCSFVKFACLFDGHMKNKFTTRKRYFCWIIISQVKIQFDTLVFLNLGNKLFTGAKWKLRNATESGWTMCTSHLFLGFLKIILTDNKCTFRHFHFIMSSIGSRLS